MSCLTPKLPGSTPKWQVTRGVWSIGTSEHVDPRKNESTTIASRHSLSPIVSLKAAKAERLGPLLSPPRPTPATWMSHCFCKVQRCHPSLDEWGPSQTSAVTSPRSQYLEFIKGGSGPHGGEKTCKTSSPSNIFKISISLIFICVIKPHRALNKS